MTQSARASKGSVTVSVDRNRLRLNLPRQLYGGQKKFLTLGMDDTPGNRVFAEAKAKEIEKDILYERFDYTLNKYRPEHMRMAESSTTAVVEQKITCSELWSKYFEFKRSSLKPKTADKYNNLGKLFDKLGSIDVCNALDIKKQLELLTTPSRVKDGLMYLNACCTWGVQHSLIASNPYAGMYNDLPKHKYQTDPKPNAFTEEERDRIIEAFKTDSRPGINFRRFAPFVEFMFFVGCRPSEAVGLQWKHVSDDCGSISFEGSLVQVGNRRVRSEGSKNNKFRRIAVSGKVRELLQSIKPEDVNRESLVFPGFNGDSINYRNFSRRAWSAIVDPIKPDTTPYSCRDTFITIQILKGVSDSIIANWCDTSADMIRRYYTDKLKLAQLRPID